MSFAHETPFGSTRQETVIGIVLFIIVIAMLVFFLASNKNTSIDSEPMNFHTTLSKSYGVSEGASIRMKGLVIGQVTSVGFNDNADIKINFTLNAEHAAFYTNGSYLQPDSALGLDTVLSGIGLVFYSAGTTGPAIPTDSFIEAKEAKSLNESLADINIKETIAKVEGILSNMQEITGSVAENRDSIQDIMQNTAKLTDSMMETNKTMNQLLVNLESMTAKSNEMLDTKLSENLTTLTDTMKEYQGLAADLREITTSLTPTIESSPKLVEDIEALLFRSNVVMMKLSNHWLLNSSDSKKPDSTFRLQRSNKKPKEKPDTEGDTP